MKENAFDFCKIKLSAGALSPAFAAATTSYTASVAIGVTSITVTPTAADPSAAIKINGTPLPAGLSVSKTIPLTAGANTISILVTSSDGTASKTYTITVNYPLSANDNLSWIQMTAGELSPAFNAATTSYTVNVIHNVQVIKITPSTPDPEEIIQVNGITIASGGTSAAIPLNGGANTISIAVTSNDGTASKTYTVTVMRALSNDDNLASIQTSLGQPVQSGPLSIDTAMTLTTAYEITSLTVTPTTESNFATVKVNGVKVTSGTASGTIPLSVGVNNIIIVVTAPDKVTTRTYTLAVTRPGPVNSNLTAITLSQGTLSPAFTYNTNFYSANVSYSASSITATPTASDPAATISVNSTAVTSGAASGPIPLLVGANSISIAVNDGSDPVNTYAVTVYRAPSPNDTLSALTVSSGSLNPAFAGGTLNYTDSLANSVTSISVTPTAADPGARIYVSGTAVASGATAGPFTLAAGSNTIPIFVVAPDNSHSQSYTITVNRAGSNNDNLASIGLNAGTLSPAFSATTTSYTDSVPNSVNPITITPVASDRDATITVDGVLITTRYPSVEITTFVGNTIITVVVKSSDGTASKTYTITVTRAGTNNDNLTALRVSAGALSPAFSPTTTSYTLNVPLTVSSTTVTAALSDGEATIQINGVAVLSGAKSAPINLLGGTNIINVVVTASDGITSQTYTITIIRPTGAEDDYLSAITSNAGTLSPAFSPGTTNYVINGISGLNWIEFTPTPDDPNATITENGTPVVSGYSAPPVDLSVEATTINFTVTGSDGITSQTYTVTANPQGNDKLSSLAAGAGSLSPVFSPDSTTYTALVATAVSSDTVTPTTGDPAATVTVNGVTVSSGTASAPIPLAIGPNTIAVVVTASNGIAKKTYTVVETRAPSPSASLSALKLNAGTLNTAFVSTTINYNEYVAESVTGIRVTPTASDPAATIKVNGVSVLSAHVSALIPLTDGNNTITIVVTASDGVTQTTYTVNVGRGGIPALQFIYIGGANPKLGASNYYSVNTTDTLASVNASAVLSGSAITVNGVLGDQYGNFPTFPLALGPNILTIIVTTPNGALSRTYTFVVNRLVSNVSTLFDLTLSGATLKPAFSSAITSYTTSVANGVATVTVSPYLNNTNATVTVNGIVPSGAYYPATVNVPLAVGANTIAVVITAQDRITTTTYTVVVTRAAPMNIPDDTVSVTGPVEKPTINDDAIVVHQGISPNGDGINDFLVIDGILAYPNNKLSIMNRNGQLIFEAKGYDNSSKVFDGHSNKNGQMQLPGTYFYQLDYTIKGIIKHKTGYLVLKY